MRRNVQELLEDVRRNRKQSQFLQQVARDLRQFCLDQRAMTPRDRDLAIKERREHLYTTEHKKR